MIMEMFYSKELKEIIADLRAKDDLNDEALDYNNSILSQNFLIFPIISALLFFAGGYIYLPVLLLVTYPLAVTFDIRLQSKNLMLPYLIGEKKEAVLKRKVKTFYGDVIVFHDENQHRLDTPYLYKLRSYRNNACVEQKYCCFINPYNNKKCMPAIEGLMHKFCLSKSILEDCSITK